MPIRPETIHDYAAIAAVNARAFDERAAEPSIVALLRQGIRFDPALSLVAEVEGHVIGHVLFTPHTVQILGQPVAAVVLAPLAIDPTHQRKGWGGRLIEAGHAAARARGYAFSFLLGHHTYYPRFGYRTHVYGAATLTLPAASLAASASLAARPLRAADVPALHALWQATEVYVDFALDPGQALLDWISPNPAITATVYESAGHVVAHTRVHQAEPHRPRAFLARDAGITRAVAAHLAHATGAPEVVLPVHPASAAANGLPAIVTPWQAAMVCPLAPSSLDEYLTLLAAGQRPAGCVVWPVAFDLA